MMDLFTVSSKQVTAYLTNVNTITAGQSSGIFSLTNVDNSNFQPNTFTWFFFLTDWLTDYLTDQYTELLLT